MTKQIRAYGEGLILEWLLDEFEEGLYLFWSTLTGGLL